MGKQKRARSLTGPEIVNACLCAGHHDGSLLQEVHKAGAGSAGPSSFRTAREYYGFLQATVLCEVRAQVRDVLLAARRPQRAGRHSAAGRGGEGDVADGEDGDVVGLGVPVFLTLDGLQCTSGRPLASLSFSVHQPARGPVGPKTKPDALSQLRPGGVFLLRPTGAHAEVLAVVDGRSSSPACPAMEVLAAALPRCGLGGGSSGADLPAQAPRAWQAWAVTSVLLGQRCVDVCQRRPAPPAIMNRLLGGAQATHIRFGDSDDSSGEDGSGGGGEEGEGGGEGSESGDSSDEVDGRVCGAAGGAAGGTSSHGDGALEGANYRTGYGPEARGPATEGRAVSAAQAFSVADAISGAPSLNGSISGAAGKLSNGSVSKAAGTLNDSIFGTADPLNGSISDAAASLNGSQARALRDLLSESEGLSLVQGPPGTGKTRLLVALLVALAGAAERARTGRGGGKGGGGGGGYGGVGFNSVDACSSNGVGSSHRSRRLPPGHPSAPRVLVCAPSNKAVLELLLRFVAAMGPSRAHRDVALIGDADKLILDSPQARPWFIYSAVEAAAQRLDAAAAALAALSGAGFCSEQETCRLVRVGHTQECRRRARWWAVAVRGALSEVDAVGEAMRERAPVAYAAGMQRPLGMVLAGAAAALRRAAEALPLCHPGRRSSLGGGGGGGGGEGWGQGEGEVFDEGGGEDGGGSGREVGHECFGDSCSDGDGGSDDSIVCGCFGGGAGKSACNGHLHHGHVHNGSLHSRRTDRGRGGYDTLASTWPCLRRSLCASALGDTVREAADALRSACVRDGAADELFLSARFVFCTCSVAGSHLVRQLSGSVAWLVLDEASQATEPEAIVPFGSLPRRAVVCGDPRQLAPMARTRPMERTLMDRLTTQLGQPHLFLDTQYRMHPDISAFPRSFFYGGRLRDAPSTRRQGDTAMGGGEGGAAGSGMGGREVLAAPHRGAPSLASAGWLGPLTVLDVPGREERSGAGSICNRAEAHAVASALRSLRDTHRLDVSDPSTLKVLTFYSAQVAAIRHALREAGLGRVFVSTVDGAQGSEASVVMLSCVRASGSLGFLQDQRRLNVGLTRAQRLLLIFAHVRTLAGGAGGTGATAALVRHAADVGRIYSWHPAGPRPIAEAALASIRALAARAPTRADESAGGDAGVAGCAPAESGIRGEGSKEEAVWGAGVLPDASERVREIEEYVRCAREAEEDKSRKRRRREQLERVAFQPPTSYSARALAAMDGA